MAALCLGGKLVLLANAGFGSEDEAGGEGVSNVEIEEDYNGCYIQAHGMIE